MFSSVVGHSPGIISTGLEMWQGKACAPRFRERLWGESVMLRKILLNPKCWLEHLSLNHTTGAVGSCSHK